MESPRNENLTMSQLSYYSSDPHKDSSQTFKMTPVKVQMLDDSITFFKVRSKALSRILFEQVCKELNLLEVDYFGLEYKDSVGVSYWLDLDKPLETVTSFLSPEHMFFFSVKFYTPDPAQIEEEYTRYLFSLQIKRDLSIGSLTCNANTAAVLVSYIVQSECGDFVFEDYPNHTYLSAFTFVPFQDTDLEIKIMENHKKHIGQSPAEADMNLLETARRCEFYGIKLHGAKDHEGVSLNLAVAHCGVLIFQNMTKINTFSWAKIRKLSFKRKKFLIKLHPEGYGYFKDTVEFLFEDRNYCKNFWKKCVEYHGFFRGCESSLRLKHKDKRRILPRGSSFRYNGKTQKEMHDNVRENFAKRRESFQRYTRQYHSCVSNENSHVVRPVPLLPLEINQIVSSSSLCSPSLTTNESMIISPNEPPTYSSIFTQNYKYSTLNRQNMDKSGNEEQSSSAILSTSTPLRFGENGNSRLQIGELSDSSLYTPITRPYPLLREDSVDCALSPIHVGKATNGGHDTDTETRRKRYPSDTPYLIAKELLMTERTYNKDLEIINVWFRDEVKKEEKERSMAKTSEDFLIDLFTHVTPLTELHSKFLKDIESRMSFWEGRASGQYGDTKKIGDVFCRNFDSLTLDCYSKYIENHFSLLEKLESTLLLDTVFYQIFKEFESQKICYLPLSTLLLKPLHRLLHYELLLERLIKSLNLHHCDWKDINISLNKVQGMIRKMNHKLKDSENFVKLSELGRDLVGGSFENLIKPEREFLREGSLQKLSRKGYSQRMFFLFSDILLYGNRTSTPVSYFKIHGQLSVKDLLVSESESRLGSDHCFTIYDGKRALFVSASNEEEKNQWIHDINTASKYYRKESNGIPTLTNKFTSLKSISGSEDGLDRGGSVSDLGLSAQQRTNSSVHVCWHRQTTASHSDHHRSLTNSLSGFLLRKFKNSNGWQKLWVVFTNSCLYFFKSFQDDFPLASLPLLSYSVCKPSYEDSISKDFVFKLQFKNHVYFFRAESSYTFNRWIEVLGTITRLSEDFDNMENSQ